MEKIFQNLESINKQIIETEHEIEVVETLPFYKIFTQEEQRESDLNLLRVHKRNLLSAKLGALETLQIHINLLKVDISNDMRELSLATNHIPIAS